MLQEQDTLYTTLCNESKNETNLPPRFRFHEQHYVGGGAHGANFLLDKITDSGKVVVQKVEKVANTEGKGICPFSEVVYVPNVSGLIKCDDETFLLSKKQILRLKGSVASYIVLRKLRDEPATQKIINDPYLGNVDREFFRLNQQVYQRTTMLYEPGVSLDEFNKVLPLDFVRMLHLLTGALQTYNDKRIIHRDIKPGNIVINKKNPGNSDFKIIDFSTCRIRTDMEGYEFIDPDVKLLLETVVREFPVGTPGYMSKEAILGEPSFSTDLYSLGVTGYKVLKNRFPFCDYKNDQMKLLMSAVTLTSEKVDQKVDDLIRNSNLNKDLLALMLNLCSPRLERRDPQGLIDITSKIIFGEVPLYKSSSVSMNDFKLINSDTSALVLSEEEDSKMEEPSTLDLTLAEEKTTALVDMITRNITPF